MEYKESKKIQYLYDRIRSMDGTNRVYDLHCHIEITDGVDENLSDDILNDVLPEEVSQTGGDNTLKIGMSLDDCELTLHIASIVITCEDIVSEDIINVVNSLNVFRDVDIDRYLKLLDVINGIEDEADKLMEKREEEFKRNIEKIQREFKTLKFTGYNEEGN